MTIRDCSRLQSTPGQLEAGRFGYLAALVGIITIALLALVGGFRPSR